VKRKGLLLGIAALLVPLGGCSTLAPLVKDEPAAPAKPAATATATPNPAMVPPDVNSAIASAQAARKSGDLPGSAKILSQLVLASPDDPKVLGEYGKTLAAQGRSDDAVAFLDRAIQLDPSDWSLYSAQGIALDQKGKYQEAQSYYARALMLKPGEASVLNNDALSHMQSGDLDGAEKLLRMIAPGGADPRIEQNLALVQSLKAAKPADAAPPAAPAPEVAPAAVATLTPFTQAPKPAAAPETPAATPTVTTRAVAQQDLAPPPAPAAIAAASPAPVPAKESPKVEVLKADTTIRMQPAPKAATSPAATPKAPEKKLADVAPAKSAAAPAPAAKVPAATPAAASAPKMAVASNPSSGFYVQTGSFPNEARAGQAALALDSMGARVMQGSVDGHAVYRVRIGPFLNKRQASAAVEQAHALGHADLVIVTE